MNFLSRVQHTFGFTRNETKVILLLSLTFLIGLGIRWYKSVGPAAGDVPQFDYAESDREFLERSRKAAELLAQAANGRPEEHPRKHPMSKHGVNINAATKEQLMQLPGIGAEYAERIIAYRKAHGPFSATRDLVNVRGIGRQRFEHLAPYITTGTQAH